MDKNFSFKNKLLGFSLFLAFSLLISLSCNNQLPPEPPEHNISDYSIYCAPDGRIALGIDSSLVIESQYPIAQKTITRLIMKRPDGITIELPIINFLNNYQILSMLKKEQLSNQSGAVEIHLQTETGETLQGNCRLFHQPTFDKGHSNEYPRLTIPYQGQARDVKKPVAVQIGTVNNNRSVLLTEAWVPLTPGYWLEQYQLINKKLVANTDVKDQYWKPFRDNFIDGLDENSQIVWIQKGIIIYNNSLDSIPLNWKRSHSEVMVPSEAKLFAVSDTDWFLLSTKNKVNAYHYDGTTITPISTLDFSKSIINIAVRAPYGYINNSDENRSFDALILDSLNQISFIRIQSNQVNFIDSEKLGQASRAATKAIQELYGINRHPDLLALGDLDGDGLQDLVVWDSCAKEVLWAAQFDTPLGINFHTFVPLGLNLSFLTSLAIGNTNDDLLLDIATVNPEQATLYIQK